MYAYALYAGTAPLLMTAALSLCHCDDKNRASIHPSAHPPSSLDDQKDPSRPPLCSLSTDGRHLRMHGRYAQTWGRTDGRPKRKKSHWASRRERPDRQTGRQEESVGGWLGRSVDHPSIHPFIHPQFHIHKSPPPPSSPATIVAHSNKQTNKQTNDSRPSTHPAAMTRHATRPPSQPFNHDQKTAPVTPVCVCVWVLCDE